MNTPLRDADSVGRPLRFVLCCVVVPWSAQRDRSLTLTPRQTLPRACHPTGERLGANGESARVCPSPPTGPLPARPAWRFVAGSTFGSTS